MISRPGLYTRKGTGELVGATLVPAHAGEMISELTLAFSTDKLNIRMQFGALPVRCWATP